jgi:hypothetical protein
VFSAYKYPVDISSKYIGYHPLDILLPIYLKFTYQSLHFLELVASASFVLPFMWETSVSSSVAMTWSHYHVRAEGTVIILSCLQAMYTTVSNSSNEQSKKGFVLYCTLRLLSLPSPTAASKPASPCCTFSSLPFLATWRTRRGLHTLPSTHTLFNPSCHLPPPLQETQ